MNNFKLKPRLLVSVFFVFGLFFSFGNLGARAQVACYDGATWQGPTADPVGANRTLPVYTSCQGLQTINSNLNITTALNNNFGVKIVQDASGGYPPLFVRLQGNSAAGNSLVAVFGEADDTMYANNSLGVTVRVVDLTSNPEFQLRYGSGANDHWSLYVDQASDDFRIWGGGDNRLTILPSGNVGLGDNNPSTRLTVAGGLLSTGSSGINADGLLLDYSGGVARVMASDVVGGAGSQLAFYTGDGGSVTEKLRIDDFGNVGVGISTPGAKLEVVTTSGTDLTPALRVRKYLTGASPSTAFNVEQMQGTSANSVLYTGAHFLTGRSGGWYHAAHTALLGEVRRTGAATRLGTGDQLRAMHALIDLSQDNTYAFAEQTGGTNIGVLSQYRLNYIAGVKTIPNNVYGFKSEAELVSTGTNVNNYYGLYVTSPSIASGAGINNLVAIATEANAGNVGIGTTNPASRLQVAGGDLQLSSGYSLSVPNASAASNLYLGNYADGQPFSFIPGGVGQAANLTVEGRVNAGEICIQDDCHASWSVLGESSPWAWTENRDITYLRYATNTVRIGPDNATAKVHIKIRNDLGETNLLGLQVDDPIKAIAGFTDNLLSDPQFGTNNYWSNTSLWTATNTEMNNRTKVNTAEMTNSGGQHMISDHIPVDPYKTYRFSVWIRELTDIGDIRLSAIATDENQQALSIFNNTGASSATAYYFWYGDTPAGVWTKKTGYLYPCNTPNWDTNNVPPDTSWRNYRMDCRTSFVQMRLSNWNGTLESKTVWFALPKIEEVQAQTGIVMDDLYMIDSKSIRLDNRTASTTLLIGNYADSGFTYASNDDVANLAVEGDIKGNRLCIQESCLNSWASIGAQSGWTDDGTVVRLTTATDNVGIGNAAPAYKLDVTGDARVSEAFYLPSGTIDESNYYRSFFSSVLYSDSLRYLVFDYNLPSDAWRTLNLKISVTSLNSGNAGRHGFLSKIYRATWNSSSISSAQSAVVESLGDISDGIRLGDIELFDTGGGIYQFRVPIYSSGMGSGRNFRFTLEITQSSTHVNYFKNYYVTDSVTATFPGSSYNQIHNRLGVGLGNNVMPVANLNVKAASGVEGLRVISSNWSPFIIRNSGDTADIFRINETGQVTINNAYTFPTAIGSAGQVLKVPSSGSVLQWQDDNAGSGSVGNLLQVLTEGSNAASFTGLTQIGGQLSLGSASLVLGSGANLIYGVVDASSNSASSLLKLETESGGSYTQRFRITPSGSVIIGPTATAYTLPSARSTSAGYVLKTDGSGNVTWQADDTGTGALPSGSSGQTLRYGAVGWEANSILFNNGTNIGIQNTAPNDALDVTGVIDSSGGYKVDDNIVIDGTGQLFYTRSVSTNRFGAVNSSGFGIDALNSGDWDLLVYETMLYGPRLTLGYGYTNGYITTYDSNEDLYIDPNGTGRILMYGNVGIETSSPAEKVEISDGGGVARLRITDLDDNPELQLKYGSGASDHWGLYVHQTADDFRIWGGGSDRIAILTDGRIGIGATNPSTAHPVTIHNTNSRLLIRNSASNNTSGALLGSLDFGDMYSQNGQQARILVTRGATGSGGDNPTNISFWTTPDGSTTMQERMVINHAGQITINNAYTLPNSIGSAGQVLKVPSSGSALIWAADDTGTGGLPSGTSGQTLRYGAAGWEASSLLFNNSTNIGIGITSPNASLHIVGTNYQGSPTTGGTQIASGLIELTRPGNMPYIDFNNAADGTDYDARIILRGDDLLTIEGAFVGINKTTAATALDVGGDVTANTYTANSDIRLKENIRVIEDPFEIINEVNGIRFKWKESGKAGVGFSAQEVYEVLPEAVSTSTEGIMSLNYDALIPVLLEAVKQQQKQIADLQEQIEELRQRR